jgi:hypothetical protein
MPKDQVPDDNFDAGFKIGYQVVHGTSAEPPAPRGERATPFNSTLFLEGVKAGLRAAGVVGRF